MEQHRQNYNSVKGYDLFLNLYRERFDSWLLENPMLNFLVIVL